MSADDLVAKVTTHRGPGGPSFWPVVDGYFLPEPVAQIYAEGSRRTCRCWRDGNRDEPSGLVARYRSGDGGEFLRDVAEDVWDRQQSF